MPSPLCAFVTALMRTTLLEQRKHANPGLDLVLPCALFGLLHGVLPGLSLWNCTMLRPSAAFLGSARQALP
jgi:hypothetical protein